MDSQRIRECWPHTCRSANQVAYALKDMHYRPIARSQWNAAGAVNTRDSLQDMGGVGLCGFLLVGVGGSVPSLPLW
jgi:hypothetical protein